MKRVVKFITIPLQLWESSQLTWLEKVSLVEMDSMEQDVNGIVMSARTLAGKLHITEREAKDTLNSLYKKRAIEISVNEEGEHVVRALLYKEDYTEDKSIKKIASHPQVNINYDYIKEQFNTICKELSPITRFTPVRQRKIRSIINAGYTLEDLVKAFKIVASSKFLNGDNDRKWKATFDFLLNVEKLNRIFEGTYNKDYIEKQNFERVIQGKDTAEDDDEGYK